MMASGSARPMKGFGVSLCSPMKRLMAAERSTTGRKTPYLSHLRVRMAKKLSTAFSRDLDVGVKWKAQCRWRLSQARTFSCLWTA